MPLSPYEKLKRCRDRKRQGRTVLSVEIDAGAVGDLLVDHGFIEQWDTQDRSKLRAALEEALDVWAAA